jgi:acetylglutamate/LysW-gamma-L-alpha-aminoadipate kinase
MLLVVKTGGRVLDQALSNIVSDVHNLTSTHDIVFVHGGGIAVTEIATKLGKEQRFITSPSGFRSRYTDRETVDIYTMVMAGKLNKDIVAQLQANHVNAIGLSGLDGALIRAVRKKKLVIIDERGRKRAIAGGYTGRIVGVNVGLLRLLLDNGFVPVVSSIALSEEHEPLNVDGDRAAANVAGALKADRLILLTDVDGLVLDGKVVPRLTPVEAKAVLKQIGGGMITKVHAAIEALSLGSGEVVIASGFVGHPLTGALQHTSGTVINNG